MDRYSRKDLTSNGLVPMLCPATSPMYSCLSAATLAFKKNMYTLKQTNDTI